MSSPSPYMFQANSPKTEKENIKKTIQRKLRLKMIRKGNLPPNPTAEEYHASGVQPTPNSPTGITPQMTIEQQHALPYYYAYNGSPVPVPMMTISSPYGYYSTTAMPPQSPMSTMYPMSPASSIYSYMNCPRSVATPTQISPSEYYQVQQQLLFNQMQQQAYEQAQGQLLPIEDQHESLPGTAEYYEQNIEYAKLLERQERSGSGDFEQTIDPQRINMSCAHRDHQYSDHCCSAE